MSSPSHPRLDSGKGEWHSQWYLIHFSDATHLDAFRLSLNHSLHKHDQIDQQEGEKL
ncbi:MAG: hypothetical protein ACJ8BW_16090 [Ktedonobacteraceae bacterium]